MPDVMEARYNVGNNNNIYVILFYNNRLRKGVVISIVIAVNVWWNM